MYLRRLPAAFLLFGRCATIWRGTQGLHRRGKSDPTDKRERVHAGDIHSVLRREASRLPYPATTLSNLLCAH